MSRCACGADATANGRECPTCFRARLLSVRNGYTPSRTGGGIDTHRTRQNMSRLEDYAAVRKEGSQPAGTDRQAIEDTKLLSDSTGVAWRSDADGRERQMQEAIA